MNQRLTIGLLLVLAVVAVYVLVVQVPKDKAAANATPSAAASTYLWTAQASQINGVHLVDKVKGQALDLVKAPGGAWSLTQPGPQPADQSLAASDVTSLTTLAVDGTITTATDLTAFGVLSPTFTMEIDLADGSKLKAAIGDKVPAGTDYYALREGEKQVVLLSSTAHDTLTNLLASPPVVAPTTVPTPGPGTPTWTPLPTQTLTPTPTLTATSTLAATASGAATATPLITTVPIGTATP
jgi:hypothetical protein